MSDTGPATVATLPPGSSGCQGIPRAGHVTPNVLCRGCLRYQLRSGTDHRLMPAPIGQPDGTFWCQDRIGA